MATKKSTTKKAPAKVNASAGAPTVEEAINNNELVAEAAINLIVPTDVETPAPKAKEIVVSADVVVINTSYNPICLTTWEKGHRSITIAPKEFKRIPRDQYREFLKNKMVRTWFDKGVLTTRDTAEEASANEAEAPEELLSPVERTDGQSSVSATVRKFQKDSPIKIQL